MTSCDETAVDDELQAFIADCEFKTRKILRESNSRARENAKLLGAKDRLQRLKSGGPPAIVGGPLSKSSSLDLSKPRTPAKKTTPRNNDNIHNPSKPWKEKDRIIHEAAETLKALDRSSKTGHSMGHLHKSLTTSPFRSKRPAPKTKAPKSAGENAMITRRTIERDFYIMSKKRDNPLKLRQKNEPEVPVPELKTSVLRSLHRCDERYMKLKQKRAERLYRRFTRLKNPAIDDMAAESDESSDSSDDEEGECSHALHELLERHVTVENARSLKRSARDLKSAKFPTTVKEMWALLSQGGNDIKCSRDGQVDSVSLEDAYEELDDTELSIGPTRGLLPRVCPGNTKVGKRGLRRLIEPHVDPDPMFPIWPSDIMHPPSLDVSQVTAHVHRVDLGPQKGSAVRVLCSLRLESPVLSPYCYAEDKGYVVPPFAKHEVLSGEVPFVELPCETLLRNPVVSRLDTLLPPTVVILDPAATERDWEDAPRDGDGNVHHLRHLEQFNSDGFRISTYADRAAVEYDGEISSRVYGISEKAALPNKPATAPLLTHTSRELVTDYLSRVRTASDFHYIAESSQEGTRSEPSLFVTFMSAYNPVHITRKSVSSYRDEKEYLRASKEAEQRKLEIALKMRAAEEMAEERLRRRIEQIEESVTRPADDGCATSVVVEEPVRAVEAIDRIPCDVEVPTSLSPLGKDECEGDDGNDLEQLASLLLGNDAFIKALSRKLGISEDEIRNVDGTEGGAEPNSDADVSAGGTRGGVDEGEQHGTPPPSETAMPLVPTVNINCMRFRDKTETSTSGDGWKRLPRQETISGDFSLTKRHVRSSENGPKIRDRRSHISVKLVDDVKYRADPSTFATETRSLFVADLSTERLRLARAYRERKSKAKERKSSSLLDEAQQQTLREIRSIPYMDGASLMDELEVAVPGDKDEPRIARPRGGIEEDDSETPLRPIDHAAKAILAVKNHNLKALEELLDTQNVPVDTRDLHGNTLFILACQQGSKRQAKFLLRRGANINAQNNSGCTCLHFLYEYRHNELAEYLQRKGADTSVLSVAGLTVFEGLTQD